MRKDGGNRGPWNWRSRGGVHILKMTSRIRLLLVVLLVTLFGASILTYHFGLPVTNLGVYLYLCLCTCASSLCVCLHPLWHTHKSPPSHALVGCWLDLTTTHTSPKKENLTVSLLIAIWLNRVSWQWQHHKSRLPWDAGRGGVYVWSFTVPYRCV